MPAPRRLRRIGRVDLSANPPDDMIIKPIFDDANAYWRACVGSGNCIKFGFGVIVPRLFCKDGYSFSMQAGGIHNSIPQKNIELSSEESYTAFECVFPEGRDGEPRRVSTDAVSLVIRRHGGVDMERTVRVFTDIRRGVTGSSD